MKGKNAEMKINKEKEIKINKEKGIKLNKEKMLFLKQELREYEKATPMTEEERKALHEWVAAGNSVHENCSIASYENGRPIDFLDIYRKEEEIRRALSSMSYDEGSRYLLEEYGSDRDSATTQAPPTYEKLKAKADRLYKTCCLYREFLAANNLREEADEYVRRHIDEEWPFDSFDWDIAQ